MFTNRLQKPAYVSRAVQGLQDKPPGGPGLLPSEVGTSGPGLPPMRVFKSSEVGTGGPGLPLMRVFTSSEVRTGGPGFKMKDLIKPAGLDLH